MSNVMVTGWGFRTDVLETIPVSYKILFLKNNLPEIFDKMMEEFDLYDTRKNKIGFCREWIDEYSDGVNQGFGVLFAKAVSQNEKDFAVDFLFGEFDDESAVLYQDRMPWEMTDRVKAMSAEDMSGIFNKYLHQLGISCAIGRLTVGFDV